MMNPSDEIVEKSALNKDLISMKNINTINQNVIDENYNNSLSVKDRLIGILSKYNIKNILNKEDYSIYNFVFDDVNYLISFFKNDDKFFKIDSSYSLPNKNKFSREIILNKVNDINKSIKSTKMVLIDTEEIDRISVLFSYEVYVFSSFSKKEATEYFEKGISLIETCASSFFEMIK